MSNLLLNIASCFSVLPAMPAIFWLARRIAGRIRFSAVLAVPRTPHLNTVDFEFLKGYWLESVINIGPV
jgi:hypothetical protein